jgi:hypothetical protein
MKKWHEYLFDALAEALIKARLGKTSSGAKMETAVIGVGSFYSREKEENSKRSAVVAFLSGLHQSGLKSLCPVLEAHAAAKMDIPLTAPEQFEICRAVKEPKPADMGFIEAESGGINAVFVCTGRGTAYSAAPGLEVVEVGVDSISSHPKFRGWRRHPEHSIPVKDRA